MVFIKVTNNNTTRKIPIEETSSWGEIVERLSNFFQLGTESPELTYLDREDDQITLSTIAELQEAISDGVKIFNLSSGVSKVCFHHKSKGIYLFYTHIVLYLI